METPLVNHKYLLEKFHGKGGWTYAVIPEILPDKRAHFGWVTVKGRIDNYEIKNYHLMPMGNGKLFLPVKAEIRKKIGKEEGDWIDVILFPDSEPIEIPDDLLKCLSDDPIALQTFMSYSESEKKTIIEWIYSAKKEETKIQRIVKTLNKLANR